MKCTVLSLRRREEGRGMLSELAEFPGKEGIVGSKSKDKEVYTSRHVLGAEETCGVHVQ